MSKYKILSFTQTSLKLWFQFNNTDSRIVVVEEIILNENNIQFCEVLHDILTKHLRKGNPKKQRNS